MLPAWNKNFATNLLDRKVWCNQCRRSIKATMWQCQCGLQWNSCHTHHLEPERLRASKLPSNPDRRALSNPKAKAKAKALGPGRDERLHPWLDQPPPKRARPPPAEIELGHLSPQQVGLKHHLLSPNLRAKFPRLQSPSTSSQPQHQPPQVGTSSLNNHPATTPT